MRFKINCSASSELYSYLFQAQNIHNTQVSYVSRGEDHPLTLLLRSLHNIITREDDEDQNMLLRMEMDQEMGSISIGLMKRSAQQQADKFKPDQESTISAIMQYEQSQSDLTRSLRQNLSQIKRNKMFYQHCRDQISKRSAFVQANKTIMDLIRIQPEMVTQSKIPNFSADTAQNSIFELHSANQLQSSLLTKYQKAPPINTQLCNQKHLQVQFQQLESSVDL